MSQFKITGASQERFLSQGVNFKSNWNRGEELWAAKFSVLQLWSQSSSIVKEIHDGRLIFGLWAHLLDNYSTLVCDPKRFVISESSLISSIFEPLELDAHESSHSKNSYFLLPRMLTRSASFNTRPLFEDVKATKRQRARTEVVEIRMKFYGMNGNHFRSWARIKNYSKSFYSEGMLIDSSVSVFITFLFVCVLLCKLVIFETIYQQKPLFLFSSISISAASKRICLRANESEWVREREQST